MNGRQYSGLVASLLALSLMACTGSPLAIKGGPDGRPGSTDATPKIPSPSPFVELETPGQQDEAVLDEVPGLNWALKENTSPRDQQIQRIYGALTQAGGYKFFLQQGEYFYYRTPAQTWTDTQKLASHRQYNPTRLFSDGDWLFFVNDPVETDFSGEEKVYQAREGNAWAPSTVVPKGIVAVAGGPGVAFAATERHLYKWNGQTQSWSETPIVNLEESSVGERFLGLTVDMDSASKDLIVLLSSTDGIPYRLKRLPEGTTGYASLVDTHVSFSFAGDRPVKVNRSFLNPDLGDYRYWGFSSTGRIYYGDGNASLKPYVAQPDFERPFKGFTKLMGRFYAYRNDPFLGPQIFHLLDQNVSSRWSPIASIKADRSALAVTMPGENSLATDGKRLYVAGAEGLFSHPLLSGAPETYQEGYGGWAQESVELNRAPVNQVIYCGSAFYAKTDFGTYTNKSGSWAPFELDGRPASIFSSLYGQAATTGSGATTVFYLYLKDPNGLNGAWRKVTGRLPGGAEAKASKVFFSRDRLFVAAKVPNGEAIFQRDLKAENLHLDWISAAPDQGLASTYPTYISDGRALLAVGVDKVRVASLSEQKWKDYSPIQVMPDGTTQQHREGDLIYGVPFAVYGYAFVWVNMGGAEYRLCRATAKGWKPIVSDTFNGAKVGQVLSTDGHFLYSSTLSGENTREIVRVPIKDGTEWQPLPATYTSPPSNTPTLKAVPLAQVGLKVNAPPFIDRDSAKVYLPTTRGILGP